MAFQAPSRSRCPKGHARHGLSGTLAVAFQAPYVINIFFERGTCGNSQSGTYATHLSDSTVIHCVFVHIPTFSIGYTLFHKQAVQSDVDYRTPCVPFEPTGMDYRTPSPWTIGHLFLGFPSPFRGLSGTSTLRNPLCE